MNIIENIYVYNIHIRYFVFENLGRYTGIGTFVIYKFNYEMKENWEADGISFSICKFVSKLFPWGNYDAMLQ